MQVTPGVARGTGTFEVSSLFHAVSLLAVSFKCVPGFLLQVSLSVYIVGKRHDSVARASCPQ